MNLLPPGERFARLRVAIAAATSTPLSISEDTEQLHAFTAAPQKPAKGKKMRARPRYCWDTADESLLSSPVLNRLTAREPTDRPLILFLADQERKFPDGPSKGTWKPSKGRQGLATNWKGMSEMGFAAHLKHFVNCCFPPAVQPSKVEHPGFGWPVISHHYIFLWTMDTRGTLVLNTLENLIRFLQAFGGTLHTVYYDAHEDELSVRSGQKDGETRGPRWQIDPEYSENNFQLPEMRGYGETEQLGWDQLIPLIIQVVTYLRCVGFAYEAHLVSELFIKMGIPFEGYDRNFNTEKAYAMPKTTTGFSWTWEERLVPRSQFEMLTTVYGMKESELERLMDKWSPNKRLTTIGKQVEVCSPDGWTSRNNTNEKL